MPTARPAGAPALWRTAVALLAGVCLLAPATGCGTSDTSLPLTTYDDPRFEVLVPEGWQVEQDNPQEQDQEQDGERTDQYAAVLFHDSAREHRVLVETWRADTVSAAWIARNREQNDYLPDYEGYERIDLRREDPGDHPGDRDAAYLEFEVTSDNWEQRRRHVAEFIVSVGDHRLGEPASDAANFVVQVNVPAQDADDYADMRAEIFESFRGLD